MIYEMIFWGDMILGSQFDDEEETDEEAEESDAGIDDALLGELDDSMTDDLLEGDLDPLLKGDESGFGNPEDDEDELAKENGLFEDDEEDEDVDDYDSFDDRDEM